MRARRRMTRFASERRGNDWKGAAGGAKRSEHGTPGKRDGDIRSSFVGENVPTAVARLYRATVGVGNAPSATKL